jgi:hypothetical protein
MLVLSTGLRGAWTPTPQLCCEYSHVLRISEYQHFILKSIPVCFTSLEVTLSFIHGDWHQNIMKTSVIFCSFVENQSCIDKTPMSEESKNTQIHFYQNENSDLSFPLRNC